MNRTIIGIAAVCIAGFSLSAQADAIAELEAKYRTQGTTEFTASNGQALWNKTFKDAKTSEQRNCSSCHGDDLTRSGKHNSTGKVIDPMAPSVNTKRLTDTRKIEKWFLRNCKWTLGRECNAQEKGDVLAFLKTL